ncbi:MAG: hypothetical protein RBR34_08560 [Rhodospirillaceae bacterium]|nr:hypothetical protein [Rhodospirillaceae bacterium]
MDDTVTPAAAEQPAAIPAAETAPAAAPAATLLGGDKPAAPAADPAKVERPAQAEEKAKDGDKKADPITPESYGDFTLPEGMAPDDGVMGEFKALAAEHGMTKEAAQKLVDLQAKVMRNQQETATAVVQQWAKDAQADKELGGVEFNKNVGLARSARDAFSTPELRAILDSTGLGNHPEIIRAFYRIGKAMSEDGRVVAGAGPQGDRLAALYPTMVNKE